MRQAEEGKPHPAARKDSWVGFTGMNGPAGNPSREIPVHPCSRKAIWDWMAS
jgi:hypothetical protein